MSEHTLVRMESGSGDTRRYVCSCGRVSKWFGAWWGERAEERAMTGFKIHATYGDRRERRAAAMRLELAPDPHIEEHW